MNFLPAFDPAFVQELWLAVVDKLALGVILVGVGYVANRKLEDYRARQALIRSRKSGLRFAQSRDELLVKNRHSLARRFAADPQIQCENHGRIRSLLLVSALAIRRATSR